MGRETVAILSHGLWRARYRGDRDVVGKTIVLDDRRSTVVGVMPAGFAFPAPGSDVWVPLAFTGADRENRSGHSLAAMARLRLGIDIDAARREMDAIAEAMATESPASNRDWGIRLRPAREAVVGDTKPVLAAVAIAVALLLLVACANVAGLLLTQGLSRDREIAIRIAIGAARARIIRQILCESVLLSLAGGGLGLVLAHLAGPLVGLLRPDDFVAWKDIGVDVRAGAFAIGVSLVVGALFGLLPAMVLSDRGLSMPISPSRRCGP